MTALVACVDPPDPPPATTTRSAAIWVEWRAADQPVERPVALVVDVPGGTLDRLVADPEVTTFFNDRFHAILVESDAEQQPGTLGFYTADGCAIGPVLTPHSPDEIIAAANRAVIVPEARGRHASSFVRGCPGREPTN
ncbi:MAG: hypothetical protein EXR71_16005 [Myxococcales bacterium]|nr:hypothetical protein [Myxococcales bacterium]